MPVHKIHYFNSSTHGVLFFYFSCAQVLPKDCKEYSFINEYVKNTHAETHQQYELDILEVKKKNLFQHFSANTDKLGTLRSVYECDFRIFMLFP